MSLWAMETRFPVIFLDTRKKELIGRFKNAGREWQKKGEPDEVDVYDFAEKELGKIVPYGVYDLTLTADQAERGPGRNKRS